MVVFSYSHLEEYLFLASSTADVPRGRQHSIARFKGPLRALGIEPSGPDWQFLTEAQKIRDCLLHANGRLDLCKHREQIEKIMEKYDGQLFLFHQRLRLRPAFVNRFADAVQDYIAAAQRAAQETRRTRGRRDWEAENSAASGWQAASGHSCLPPPSAG